VRGLQVVAIIRWTPDPPGMAVVQQRPGALALKTWCKQYLEGFKVPRHFQVCEDWCFTANGKTDHRALAQALRAANDHTSETLCLTTLP
jgi:acyl-CoA synthetase (AMP-forming)/AMP-acid ligase II